MTLTILTVDDSRRMRDLLRHTLAAAGFAVIQAEDGEQGLAALGDAFPDLIITDLNMPRLDGCGLIRAVRADARRGEIPILVLSSEAAPEKKQRARTAGATRWIAKPFRPDELITAIQHVSAGGRWQIDAADPGELRPQARVAPPPARARRAARPFGSIKAV